MPDDITNKPHDIIYAIHLILRRDGDGSICVQAAGERHDYDVKNLPKATAIAINDTILGLAVD